MFVKFEALARSIRADVVWKEEQDVVSDDKNIVSVLKDKSFTVWWGYVARKGKQDVGSDDKI